MASKKDQQVDVRSPSAVSPKDDEPKGFCQVVCVLPEMDVSQSFSGKKPSDGAFQKSLEKRCLFFSVECKKKKIRYEYAVKELPGDIIPEQSKFKFDKGKVTIKLKKADNESWIPQLEANGIDQHIDDDDEEPNEKK